MSGSGLASPIPALDGAAVVPLLHYPPEIEGEHAGKMRLDANLCSRVLQPSFFCLGLSLLQVGSGQEQDVRVAPAYDAMVLRKNAKLSAALKARCALSVAPA